MSAMDSQSRDLIETHGAEEAVGREQGLDIGSEPSLDEDVADEEAELASLGHVGLDLVEDVGDERLGEERGGVDEEVALGLEPKRCEHDKKQRLSMRERLDERSRSPWRRGRGGPASCRR